MKVFAFLMAVFFAFLLTVPCSDAAASVSAKTEIETSHTTHTHNDLCPAFCTCSCCGVVMTVGAISYPSLEPIPLQMISSKIADRIPFTLFSIPSGIWQPPKIG